MTTNKTNLIAIGSVLTVAALTVGSVAYSQFTPVSAADDVAVETQKGEEVRHRKIDWVDLTEEEKAEVEARRAQKQAEREAAIDTAIEDGSLTTEQGQILEIMSELREHKREELQALRESGELEGMNRVEIKEQYGQSREEREAELLSALADAGIDVTSEDLEELRDTMGELGFRGRGRSSR